MEFLGLMVEFFAFIFLCLVALIVFLANVLIFLVKLGLSLIALCIEGIIELIQAIPWPSRKGKI